MKKSRSPKDSKVRELLDSVDVDDNKFDDFSELATILSPSCPAEAGEAPGAPYPGTQRSGVGVSLPLAREKAEEEAEEEVVEADEGVTAGIFLVEASGGGAACARPANVSRPG